MRSPASMITMQPHPWQLLRRLSSSRIWHGDLLEWSSVDGSCTAWNLADGVIRPVQELDVAAPVVACFLDGSEGLVITSSHIVFVALTHRQLRERMPLPPEMRDASRISATRNRFGWWIHFGWWRDRAYLVRISDSGDWEITLDTQRVRLWPSLVSLSDGGVILGGGATRDPHRCTVVDRFHPDLSHEEIQLIPRDAHDDHVLALGALLPLEQGLLVLTQANAVCGPKADQRGHTWSKGFFDLASIEGVEQARIVHRHTPFKISALTLDGRWARVGRTIVLLTGWGGVCAYDPPRQEWSEVVSDDRTKHKILGLVPMDPDHALMIGRDGELWTLSLDDC